MQQLELPAERHASSSDLPARTVVITGASSGIGRTVARRFANDPRVRLVLVARRADELEATLEHCGGSSRGWTLVADLADLDAPDAIAAEVERREGRCDVLVNNAGASCPLGIDDPGYADAAARVIALNLTAPLALTAAMLPLLERGDRPAIVNVSSVAGLIGLPGKAAYCATKFGLTGIGQSLYGELGERGIHVATIHPGPVPTPGWPQEHVMRSRMSGILASDMDQVARIIERSADRRGSAAPVVPRLYSPLYRLGVIWPAGLRAALRRMGRRAAQRKLHG